MVLNSKLLTKFSKFNKYLILLGDIDIFREKMELKEPSFFPQCHADTVIVILIFTMMKQIACILILLFSHSFMAHAISSESARVPHMDVDLFSETQSVQAGEDIWLGLNLTMDQGWHSYWKNPGDTGLPTKIVWKLPKGFSASEIYWPSPKRFDLNPLVNYGYDGEVLLLTKISVPKKIQTTTVRFEASTSSLVCKQECIPTNAEVAIQLPVSKKLPELNQIQRKRFDRSRSQLARDWDSGKISVTQNDKEIFLHLSGAQSILPKKAKWEFFPYENGVIQQNAQQMVIAEKNAVYTLVLQKGDIEEKELKGDLVIRSGNGEEIFSLQIKNTIQKITNDKLPIWQLLLFAFLGGIILNLMPCVLPVLGMKIMSLWKKSAQERRVAQYSAWIYTSGVLFSFWILSTILFFLRASGQSLGWGFQLQSPFFLFFLLHLFLFIGFHLLGIFRFGESVMGWGNNFANRSDWVGSFFTGILAVLVASPCTAPFMGVALGAALLQTPLVGTLIFSFLGLGLAFPFLVFTYFPGAWKILPRPGLWMERLKQAFSLPIFATIIWLFWVLSHHLNAWLLLLLAGALGILSTLIILRSRFVLIFALFSLSLGGIGFRTDADIGLPVLKDKKVQIGLVQWENFSPEIFAKAQKENRSIFIDFTAAWCLTCQVNERLVLNTEIVQKEFLAKKILALRADWTSRSPEITKLLESYSRAGVPLYVFYKAGKNTPVVFPQILTTGLVLEALEK